MAGHPNSTDTLVAFLRSIEGETDLARLSLAFFRELQRHGFGGFSLRIGNADGVMVDDRPFHGVSTYSKEWEAHFCARNYFVTSPVFRVARVIRRPFNWFEILAQPWVSKVDKYVFDEAAEFDIGIGMTIPIHLPQGRSGVLTITSDPIIDPTADSIRAAAETAHVLGLAFFEKIGALVAGRQIALAETELLIRYANDNAPQISLPAVARNGKFLTPFERDCLAWRAAGLSDAAISERCRFSESTVSGALEAARLKLGASTRTHAVVKAIVGDVIAV